VQLQNLIQRQENQISAANALAILAASITLPLKGFQNLTQPCGKSHEPSECSSNLQPLQ
jgi:hypothetical protein